MEDDLTRDEVLALAALRRLAKRWPKTLMLASMGGSLVVVRTDDERFDSESGLERQEAVVEDISGIPNTGGDW